MRHRDGVARHHQLHSLYLPGRLHVAQHPRDIRRELLVLQARDRVWANAFEQIDTPIDGAQVHAKGAGQTFLADATIDGAADHVVLCASF